MPLPLVWAVIGPIKEVGIGDLVWWRHQDDSAGMGK